VTGPRRRVPWGRLGRLALGTATMGVGIALLVASRLGMAPMDSLHLAVARALGWDLGRGILLTQAVLLLTFIPLRLRPGPATIAGFVVPAATADALLALLPPLENVAVRLVAFVLGGVLFCSGVAIYLLSRLGQLPRDGLMLVLGGDRDVAGRNGPRVAVVRIGLDVTFVAAATAILGPATAVHTGVLSVGTLALALLSGPMIARGLKVFARVPGFSPQIDGELAMPRATADSPRVAAAADPPRSSPKR
jgi:uncharacterized membrane protein YczE